MMRMKTVDDLFRVAVKNRLTMPFWYRGRVVLCHIKPSPYRGEGGSRRLTTCQAGAQH